MKRFLSLLAAFSLAGLDARAEDLNLNEKPDTVRVSLSPYSLGVGAGAVAALNPELRDNESEMFMKISIIQSVAINEMLNVGLDLDWLFPGSNWSGLINLDYTAPMQHFKPFIGVGAGMSYFDKGERFGNGFGPAASVHAGILLDVMDELQLRVRVPFTVVANHDGDRTVGVDIGLLFSSPHRNTKVKKLVY
jgi:hypothetical protein